MIISFPVVVREPQGSVGKLKFIITLFGSRFEEKKTHVCNMKGVAFSDKSTKNYHPGVQSPLTPWRFLHSFGSLFWFNILQLYCFGSVSRFSSTPFTVTVGSCFQEKERRVNQVAGNTTPNKC